MPNSPERRELKFNSLDEAVAEAERLAGGTVRTTGSHSFAEILRHLAITHDMSTGKIVGPQLPLVMRIMMPFVKGMILSKPVAPGFKLPKKAEEFLWPSDPIEVPQALAYLKESVNNYNSRGPLEVHPVFGKLSREKNIELNCNHCAMHLSFAHPV